MHGYSVDLTSGRSTLCMRKEGFRAKTARAPGHVPPQGTRGASERLQNLRHPGSQSGPSLPHTQHRSSLPGLPPKHFFLSSPPSPQPLSHSGLPSMAWSCSDANDSQNQTQETLGLPLTTPLSRALSPISPWAPYPTDPHPAAAAPSLEQQVLVFDPLFLVEYRRDSKPG